MGADPLLEAVKRMNPEPPKEGPTGDQAVEVESEAETSQDDTEAEEPKYTVKYNGEEIEVPLSELKLGYMREKDYRVKMHNVSDKSKDLEAKISSLDDKIKDAEALLELDLDYLESEEGKQLRHEDADEYLKKVEAVKKRHEKLKQHKEEKQKRETEKRKEKLQNENRLLSEKISDWLDEDVKIRETQKIVKYLQEKQGYTEEQIANIDDHRVFVMAREAVKLQDIMSKDLSAKEVKSPPKSAKPGSSERAPKKSKEDTLRQKLKETGDMRTAQQLFKEKLFGKK